MPKPPSPQIDLGFEPPATNVVQFQQYAVANECGVYDKNVEVLELRHGKHNWLLATITIAFTRQGYFVGCAYHMQSSGKSLPCSIGQSPHPSRRNALIAGKAQLSAMLATLAQKSPLVREMVAYKQIKQWLDGGVS
ncbi:MAG: hypothetical protein VXW65_08460 [Pseudomonadota bacterium]|nr:hypothetical protein [Pseudomonadota bacterium]